MKIITYGEMQWNGEKYVTTYAEYEDYTGPVAQCGGGSAGTQTVEQKSDPWGPAQAYLTGGKTMTATDMASNSKAAAKAGGPPGAWGGNVANSGGGGLSGPVYKATGPKVIGVLPEAERLYKENKKNPFNVDELAAMDMMRGRVNRDYSLLGDGGNYLGAAARGDYLGSSPFMSAYGDDILNSVNSQFSKYNRTGSGQHAGIATQELGDAAARMYQGERALQQQAAMALPNYEASRYGLIDSDIDALLQTGQMVQNRPEEMLGNYAGLISSVAGQGGSTASQQPLYRNRAGGAAGGALAGAQLGAMQGSIGGPYGALIGGLLGYAMS